MPLYQDKKGDDTKFDIERVITNIKAKLRKKDREFCDIESSTNFNRHYRNLLCDDAYDRIMERLRTELRECVTVETFLVSN
jgi:hypothetical protein